MHSAHTHTMMATKMMAKMTLAALAALTLTALAALTLTTLAGSHPRPLTALTALTPISMKLTI